jgi:hypothetical protein
MKIEAFFLCLTDRMKFTVCIYSIQTCSSKKGRGDSMRRVKVRILVERENQGEAEQGRGNTEHYGGRREPRQIAGGNHYWVGTDDGKWMRHGKFGHQVFKLCSPCHPLWGMGVIPWYQPWKGYLGTLLF